MDVYYKNGKEKSVLYEDALDGYDYNKGRYALRTFSLIGKEKELIIQLHKEGEFITSYSHFKIQFICLPFKISKVYIDNVKVDMKEVYNEMENTLRVDKDFLSLHIYGE